MIKGIAFDLEGTVVDVERAHHDAFLRLCCEIGNPMTFEEALVRVPGFIGGGDNVIAARLSELPGVNATSEELCIRKRFYYKEILQTIRVTLRPGFKQTFNIFQASGLKMAIGSLTESIQAKILLDKSGLADLIPHDMIVLKEHVVAVKPAPDVFLETAKRMGIAPNEQLVFEDSPRGVQAGVAAGSRVIGMPIYTMAVAQHNLIDAKVTRIFWDWREINAKALIENLNQE